MLENQFLQFEDELVDNCGLALPKSKQTNLEFYAIDGEGVVLGGYANIVDPQGRELIATTWNVGDNGICTIPSSVFYRMETDQCFRVVINSGRKTTSAQMSKTISGAELNYSEFINGRFIRGRKERINLLRQSIRDTMATVKITIRSTMRGELNFYALVNGESVIKSIPAYAGEDIQIDPFEIEMKSIQKSLDVFYSVTNANNLTEEKGVDAVVAIQMDNYLDYDDPFYTGLMKIVDGGTSYVRYRCNEDAMGFPFVSVGGWCGVDLPIVVRHPQPTQDDKIYTTLSGRNIVLYSEVGKEYECETDYIPEEWHDKLAIALACDEVYVDGKRLVKSDKYQIAWDEKDTLPCGMELAKATFKMKENVIHRNSNY